MRADPVGLYERFYRLKPHEYCFLKKMGIKFGFPDLILFYPRSPYCGAAIELKSTKGYATKIQKEYLLKLETIGFKCAIINNIDNAIQFLKDYMGKDLYAKTY